MFKLLSLSLFLLLFSLFVVTTTTISFVSATRVREFRIVQNNSQGYSRLVYATSASSGWKTVGYNSLLSTTSLKKLCELVGWTRVDTAEQVQGSVDSSLPSGMLITSCSSTGLIYDFESQCTFNDAASVISMPMLLRCTGIRRGGEYGVWADPVYLRLNFQNAWEVREPFNFSMNAFKYICDNSYYSNTGPALCSLLAGYPVGGSYITGRSIKDSTSYNSAIGTEAQYAVRSLYCSLGSSTTSMTQCSNVTSTSTCSTSDGLGALCDNLYAEGVVSGSYRWRFNYYYDILENVPTSYSTFPTYPNHVCDDGFSASDAEFFCKLLGYPSDRASWYSSSSGHSSSNTFSMRYIDCLPSYTSFSECTYTSYYGSVCSSSETVHVQCPYRVEQTGTPWVSSGSWYLRTLTSDPVGQLQIASSTLDTNPSLVCDTYFSYETAGRICSFLNRGDRGTWRSGGGKIGQQFGMTTVKCYSNDNTLSQCSYSTYASSCTLSSQAVEIGACYYQSVGLLVGNYYMRFSDDGKYRLEVKRVGTTQWGTIAYSAAGVTISSTTGRALCAMMNFSGSTASVRSVSGGSGPILFEQLVCASNKQDLDSCTFAADTTGDNINHYNDLGLSCGTMATPSSSSYSSSDNGGEIVGIAIGFFEKVEESEEKWRKVFDEEK